MPQQELGRATWKELGRARGFYVRLIDKAVSDGAKWSRCSGAGSGSTGGEGACPAGKTAAAAVAASSGGSARRWEAVADGGVFSGLQQARRGVPPELSSAVEMVDASAGAAVPTFAVEVVPPVLTGTSARSAEPAIETAPCCACRHISAALEVVKASKSEKASSNRTTVVQETGCLAAAGAVMASSSGMPASTYNPQ